jgi:hypothetical protein
MAAGPLATRNFSTAEAREPKLRGAGEYAREFGSDVRGIVGRGEQVVSSAVLVELDRGERNKVTERLITGMTVQCEQQAATAIVQWVGGPSSTAFEQNVFEQRTQHPHIQRMRTLRSTPTCDSFWPSWDDSPSFEEPSSWKWATLQAQAQQREREYCSRGGRLQAARMMRCMH